MCVRLCMVIFVHIQEYLKFCCASVLYLSVFACVYFRGTRTRRIEPCTTRGDEKITGMKSDGV